MKLFSKKSRNPFRNQLNWIIMITGRKLFVKKINLIDYVTWLCHFYFWYASHMEWIENNKIGIVLVELCLAKNVFYLVWKICLLHLQTMHYIIFYIKTISKYCIRFNDCDVFTFCSNKEKSNKYMKYRWIP